MAEPQPVPINAKFGDDFVTQLVVVLDSDTMQEVAQKVAHHVVGRRIRPQSKAMAVTYNGAVVPQQKSVAEAGIEPLGIVYVDYVA